MTTPLSPELHIASFALRCDPARMAGLLAQLRQIPGAEIGAQDADSGKIVVVMEAPDEGVITRTLSDIQLMPGMASAALVYQHILNTDERDPMEGSPK